MVASEDGLTTGVSGRCLRRDAQLNRERVLAAAVAAMLRQGRHVPMTTIAREAGVGIATLYRSYPTREDLLQAVTGRSFGLVLAAALESVAREGPALDALDWFLERTIEHRAELVLPLHGGPSGLSTANRAVQAEVHQAIASVLERGRRDGSVRSDVTTTDVVIFGATLAQPLAEVPDWDTLARRQKTLFLIGVSAPLASAGAAP